MRPAAYRIYRWCRTRAPITGATSTTITPIAIGVGEDSFWPSLAVAHEIGHFVDHAGLPGTGYQSVVRTMPEDSSHREGARGCLRRVLDASAGAVGAGSCPVHGMAFGEQADA